MQDMYGEDAFKYEDSQSLDQSRKKLMEFTKSSQLKYRDEQIPKILNQMNDLADIYKQMSLMVIEQGTIMDRIDENVFEARFQAHEGKKQVQEVLEMEKSPRAHACILCLV